MSKRKTSKTTDQINAPRAPGLYEYRWQHGPAHMLAWRDAEVRADESGALVVVQVQRPGSALTEFAPLGEFTGAEWRKKSYAMGGE